MASCSIIGLGSGQVSEGAASAGLVRGEDKTFKKNLAKEKFGQTEQKDL